MWSIVAFGIFVLAGLGAAQNPYALKRPSYCSTCFSNDQGQNYYCCFYFFRCCAESRLGSNNRKVTTPSPEYPGFQTTREISSPEEEHTTKEATLATPGEKKSEKHIPGNQDSARPGATGPGDDEDGVLSGTNGKHATSRVPASKTSENMSPDYVDSSRPRDVNRFRGPGAERTSSTSYSSAYGGRRYPYNVPRVYPVQQPSRNTERRTPDNRNSYGLSGPDRSNTRYGEVFESSMDSTVGKAQQRRRTGGGDNTGDVFWGRMEPVEENGQEA